MKKMICLILAFATLVLSACQTVTSGEDSVVVSGGIGASLYLGDKKCDGNSRLFENIIWEPGMCATETVTVKNDGVLALKYSVELDAENGSELFIDSLRVVIIENYEKDMERAEVMALFEDLDSTVKYNEFVKEGVLEADGSESFTVAVYCSPELSAEVSLEDVKDCVFKINLLVTQLTEEDDSFGDMYDPE